ncbi:hypothetical protein D4765_19020, partial [Subtercola vilae]
MTRSRASAKAAGHNLERSQADYWAVCLNDERIDIRPRNGAKDRGDIGGIYLPHGGRLVIECKD